MYEAVRSKASAKRVVGAPALFIADVGLWSAYIKTGAWFEFLFCEFVFLLGVCCFWALQAGGLGCCLYSLSHTQVNWRCGWC